MSGKGLDNTILLADTYKLAHHLQYPPNTTKVMSYFESRGGKFPKTVFFGLQYVLKRWLVGEAVTRRMIDEAPEYIANEIPDVDFFNKKGWEYILERHNGKLPLRFDLNKRLYTGCASKNLTLYKNAHGTKLIFEKLSSLLIL